MAGGWTEHVVTDDEAGSTVRELLRGPMGISGRMLQRLTRARGLRLNRGPAALDRRVRAGDTVAARLPGAAWAGLDPVEMELDILHEDDDLLALNKPPFVLVHPTAPTHTATLAHGVAAHQRAAGAAAGVHPVHRIDRDTSGVVLFAKSPHAHHRMDLQLRDGAIERDYLALVQGVVAEDGGVIDAPIGRSGRDPSLREVRSGGDPALTRWRVEERLPAATLLRCRLETGRTHQIRVHLAHLGHPVLGDRAYGAAPTRLLRRQALHAERLAFAHPTGGAPIELRAPLPDDLAAALDALRAG
jgi:23S rRNA pseudouridine1911/1915/1917 synthase